MCIRDSYSCVHYNMRQRNLSIKPPFRAVSVSYTHLDVYKRQGLGSAVANVVIKNNPVPMEMVGVEDRFVQVGAESFLREEYGLTAAHIVEAVSYTHLDVYKRQDHYEVSAETQRTRSLGFGFFFVCKFSRRVKSGENIR